MCEEHIDITRDSTIPQKKNQSSLSPAKEKTENSKKEKEERPHEEAEEKLYEEESKVKFNSAFDSSLKQN